MSSRGKKVREPLHWKSQWEGFNPQEYRFVKAVRQNARGTQYMENCKAKGGAGSQRLPWEIETQTRISSKLVSKKIVR